MSADAWISVGVVLLAMAALLLDRFSPDLVLFLALTVLLLAGVVTIEEALAGFANPAVLTIAALFIVSAAVRNTGLLDRLCRTGFKNGGSEPGRLTRLMLPVTAFSAFLNNIPLVVMLTPVITGYVKKRGLSASKLLIPLSYAAIFGGMCSLIGTSTNLIVDGMMRERGMAAMGMFEIGAVGVPLALLGWGFMVAIGRHLLPARRTPLERVAGEFRDFVAEMRLEENSPLAGRTVQEAGLRHLKGLFLTEIERGGTVIAPVEPTEPLAGGDRLVFVGAVDTLVELQKLPGLVPAAKPHYDFLKEHSGRLRLVEAVVSKSSPLVGRSIREAAFRTHYDAVVIAVHRNGERVRGKIGDVVLRSGDTLLIECGDTFVSTWYNSPDFYLVSDVQEAVGTRPKRWWLVPIVVVLMVTAAAAGPYLPEVGGSPVSMVHASVLAAVVLIITGCVTRGQARESIGWQVLIVIACALGVARAIEKTGAADVLASHVVGWFEPFGAVGVLAGIYLVTTILCEVVTSKAAVVIVMPLALAAAGQASADPRPFAFAAAIAACASFVLPVGYQTNLIVFGPGGYRTRDFVRVGLPLKILVGVAAVALIPLIWPL
ncbi:MAG: SLC13 family permease [Phycisphaerae bacterium]